MIHTSVEIAAPVERVREIVSSYFQMFRREIPIDGLKIFVCASGLWIIAFVFLCFGGLGGFLRLVVVL